MSENFFINIISIEGKILTVNVKPDLTIERVKMVAIKHFYGQDASRMISQFRLIHSSKFKQLTDSFSVGDEEIEEYDELVLVEIRPTTVTENLCEDALKGPNQEAIVKATHGLSARNITRPTDLSTDSTADFQNDIRNVLITLVQASAMILKYSPDAHKFYDIIKEKLEVRCRPTIDPKMVKTLTEMGYTHKRVLKALYLRKSTLTEALQWLIEHQDDSDSDDDNGDLDLSIIEADTNENIAGPSSSSDKSQKKSLKNAYVEMFKGSTHIPGIQDMQEEDLVKIVNLLLESFRHYKKLDFKPNPRALHLLLEMGFEEKNIIAALKITGNDQANACKWLLGERRRSLQDLDEGLDPDGPIYEAIMNNPHIQLSLTNPEMLLAYLSMLETPASTNEWMNDPQVSPVLRQIFKTCDTEKRATHVNRSMMS